ncbi:ATP synthase subunit alpha [Striga asiatica]|uniref:ATP synthase subunit alpha n=1 Tax=Striga asiatica TaxID=4170 RepID=A0A5A7PX65_STRAF|nr:ATP synthase subunit alpha [Striga asiatica]
MTRQRNVVCFSYPLADALLSIRRAKAIETFLSCHSNENGNNVNTDNSISTSPPVRPRITPPETVEIRFKRGSKKRRKQQQKEQEQQQLDKMARKDWDSMSLAEKAIELYVGEKGLLFWLNKFAYASIFIVIGGWIVFRFVGPALNLYQLDTPPLSPNSILKGS